MTSDNELYEVLRVLLGVKEDSSLQDIKAAFKKRAIELHPDKVDIDPDVFIALLKAYEILTDDLDEEDEEKVKIPDLRELAKVKVQKFFNDILVACHDNRILNSDMIGNMKVFLRTDTLNIDKEIKNTKARIKLFEGIRDSISTDEDNFLGNIIEQHLLSFDKNLSDCDRRKEINKIAVEMLDSFTFLIKL